MKSTALRINKKMRIKGVRKLKSEVNLIVGACLEDIRWYIVEDILKYLKKKGLVVYAKKQKKNKKKTKKS